MGGDYYDFIPLPDGRLVLVAGDASGHGMAAGLLMAIANATLHTAVDVDPRPAAGGGDAQPGALPQRRPARRS